MGGGSGRVKGWYLLPSFSSLPECPVKYRDIECQEAAIWIDISGLLKLGLTVEADAAAMSEAQK